MGRTITSEMLAESIERLSAYALEGRPLFPRGDQFKQGRVYLHGLLLDGERSKEGTIEYALLYLPPNTTLEQAVGLWKERWQDERGYG